mgnify:CR=1 FL=1
MKFIKRGAQKIVVFRRMNHSSKIKEIIFLVKKDPDYSFEFIELQKLINLIEGLKNVLMSFLLGAPKG